MNQPLGSAARHGGQRPTGPAVAAIMATLLGAFALMFADQTANHSKAIEAWVYSLGKWMPGSVGSGPEGAIGPYAGKETIWLFVWFVSWAILHGAMRNSSPSVAKSLKYFLIGMVIVTLNFIDPLADFTFAWVKWL